MPQRSDIGRQPPVLVSRSSPFHPPPDLQAWTEKGLQTVSAHAQSYVLLFHSNKWVRSLKPSFTLMTPHINQCEAAALNTMVSMGCVPISGNPDCAVNTARMMKTFQLEPSWLCNTAEILNWREKLSISNTMSLCFIDKRYCKSASLNFVPCVLLKYRAHSLYMVLYPLQYCNKIWKKHNSNNLMYNYNDKS